MAQRVYDKNAVDSDVAVPGPDPWTLWAICISKCSRMEEYAVRYLQSSGRSRLGPEDDPYRSSIWRSAITAACWSRCIRSSASHRAAQAAAALSASGYWPSWLCRRPGRTSPFCVARSLVSRPSAVLCSRRGRSARDQPAARARLEFIIKEILTDELGHVLFLRSQLGPIRLALARGLPIIARVLIAGYPRCAGCMDRGGCSMRCSIRGSLDRVLAEVGAAALAVEGPPRAVSAEGLLKPSAAERKGGDHGVSTGRSETSSAAAG